MGRPRTHTYIHTHTLQQYHHTAVLLYYFILLVVLRLSCFRKFSRYDTAPVSVCYVSTCYTSRFSRYTSVCSSSSSSSGVEMGSTRGTTTVATHKPVNACVVESGVQHISRTTETSYTAISSSAVQRQYANMYEHSSTDLFPTVWYLVRMYL